MSRRTLCMLFSIAASMEAFSRMYDFVLSAPNDSSTYVSKGKINQRINKECSRVVKNSRQVSHNNRINRYC